MKHWIKLRLRLLTFFKYRRHNQVYEGVFASLIYLHIIRLIMGAFVYFRYILHDSDWRCIYCSIQDIGHKTSWVNKAGIEPKMAHCPCVCCKSSIVDYQKYSPGIFFCQSCCPSHCIPASKFAEWCTNNEHSTTRDALTASMKWANTLRTRHRELLRTYSNCIVYNILKMKYIHQKWIKYICTKYYCCVVKGHFQKLIT